MQTCHHRCVAHCANEACLAIYHQCIVLAAQDIGDACLLMALDNHVCKLKPCIMLHGTHAVLVYALVHEVYIMFVYTTCSNECWLLNELQYVEVMAIIELHATDAKN